MSVLLTFCFAAFCTLQAALCDDPIVEVEQGQLRGKVVEAVGGNQYYSFENVPYARPPVGDLRFKAPVDPCPWEGIRDATEKGPMCPQFSPLSGIYVAGSEDCLTLDIYTSSLEEKKPVMVFMSEFAYFFTADDKSVFGPDFMVGEIVVVLLQSRRGAFGYLNLGTNDVPGNAGLKDQVKALKWVQQNIHRFGGDPNSVTLAGISSGSASIAHHLMSPLSSGLFHRVFMQSGVTTCDAIFPHGVEEQSKYLSKYLGGPDGGDMLTYLQNVPYERLVNVSYELAMQDPENMLLKQMSTFVPVVEGDYGQERFITENLSTTLQNGIVNPVPIMIGYCDKEALIVVNQYVESLINRYIENHQLLVPNKILYKVDDTLADQIADVIKNRYFEDREISVENLKDLIACNSHSSMIYDVKKYYKTVADLAETYVFKFSSTSTRNLFGQEGLKYGISGASHGDPILYLFQPPNMPVTSQVQQFVTSVVNFVKNGPCAGSNIKLKGTECFEKSFEVCLKNYTFCEFSAGSNNPGEIWTPYSNERNNYVEFTDDMTAKEDVDEEFQFWDETIYGMADLHLYT